MVKISLELILKTVRHFYNVILFCIVIVVMRIRSAPTPSTLVFLEGKLLLFIELSIHQHLLCIVITYENFHVYKVPARNCIQFNGDYNELNELNEL